VKTFYGVFGVSKKNEPRGHMGQDFEDISGHDM